MKKNEPSKVFPSQYYLFFPLVSSFLSKPIPFFLLQTRKQSLKETQMYRENFAESLLRNITAKITSKIES